MKNYTTLSSDSTPISVSLTGQGDTALIFSHGWLGNKLWWEKQVPAFENDYLIACLDLGGHGESGKKRQNYTSKLYADDIVAVAKSLPAKEVILIGHSMSGPYAFEAAPHIPNLKSIILVDTIKDIEFSFPPEQIESMLNLYETDLQMAVEKILPNYLYASGTPEDVKERLDKEFLSQANFARRALEAFYYVDVKHLAKSVKVPVRAINSDNSPTNKANNDKYLSDYNFKVMKGTGHYPMLEDPKAFNLSLKEILVELTTTHT